MSQPNSTKEQELQAALAWADCKLTPGEFVRKHLAILHARRKSSNEYTADVACRILATAVRDLQQQNAEYEKKAEFWRKQYDELDREKLISIAIMRSVCRENDLTERNKLTDELAAANAYIAERKRDVEADQIESIHRAETEHRNHTNELT